MSPTGLSQHQKWALTGLGFIAIVFILVWTGVLPGLRTNVQTPATIEVWGIDDESVWHDLIEKFRAANPHLTVNYRTLPADTYEETLVNNLAEGRGPDVVMLKNSMILRERDKLLPLPSGSMYNAETFREHFADAPASELVQSDGSILGYPLFLDTPALFYNKDLFNATGIAKPPTTWDEAVEIAKTFTRKTEAGDIARSGLAMGTARNTDHAFEIVTALALQNGDPVVTREGRVVLENAAVEAFDFYTSFARPGNERFSWSARLPDSLEAFAQGSAAMAIGFARDIPRIQARNPHLNFGIAPLPQPTSAKTLVVSGVYYFLAVSRQSKEPNAAWQFVISATSAEGATHYLAQTKLPPAERSLIQKGGQESLAVFSRQSLLAKTWPIPDEQKTRALFDDAIDAMVGSSATAEQALMRIRERLNGLLSPFNQ